MADTKTSLESAAATLDGTELYRGVQAAANVKVTGAQIATQVLGISVAAQTGKTTPVDADVMPMSDSAASNVPKKVTWANIKATLKTYFDTLYALTGAVGSTGITMSTARLLGRSTASTGAIEEITLGTNLSFTGTTLNAAGGSPGGSTTQVQYNNAGALAGNANFTINNGTGVVTFGAAIDTSVGTMTSSVANGAAAVAFNRNTTNTFSTAGAILDRVQNNGATVFSVDKDGGLFLGNASANAVVITTNGGGSSLGFNPQNISGRVPVWLDYIGQLHVANGGNFGWTNNSTVATTTTDTGLYRGIAGRVDVCTTAAGTYGDLKLSNLIATAQPNVMAAAAPTIASAATIAPTVGITFISGTTTISTITAPSPISAGGGQITLIPTGLWATNTAGNIALATTAVVSKALILTYDTTTGKWYPSY